MAGARHCPECGSVLRRTDFPERRVVLGFVCVELVLWSAVALVLAYLAAPGGEGEAYAILAGILLIAWILLRPRQRRALEAYLERARYCCETCRRRFEGETLREANRIDENR